MKFDDHSNATPPRDASPQLPAQHKYPAPQDGPGRRFGLKAVVAILSVMVIAQFGVIVYLASGVTQEIDEALGGLSESPLFQELSALSQLRIEELGGIPVYPDDPDAAGPVQPSPRRGEDPSSGQPDSATPPSPQKAPKAPFIDPDAPRSPLLDPHVPMGGDISVEELLDVLEQFGRTLDEQLRELEDPSYRGPGTARDPAGILFPGAAA